MPLPVGVRSHSLHSFSPYLRGKHRAKPIPTKTDGFVADIDTTFMQQILDIPQRKRKPNIEHHRQANEIGAGFEILEWVAFCHAGKLCYRPAHLKLVSSDSAAPFAVGTRSPDPHFHGREGQVRDILKTSGISHGPVSAGYSRKSFVTNCPLRLRPARSL
jgi:hypothetical protein